MGGECRLSGVRCHPDFTAMRASDLLRNVQPESQSLFVRHDLSAMKGREQQGHGIVRNGRAMVDHADFKTASARAGDDFDRLVSVPVGERVSEQIGHRSV